MPDRTRRGRTLHLTFFAVVISAAGCASARPSDANETQAATLSGDLLVGTWDVALQYSPTEPPSRTEMVITKVEDRALTGTFYGSAFEVAHYAIRGDQLAFGAITSDGSGPYAHSGRWRNGRIEGQTLSTGRSFLMLWTAERRAP